MLTSKNTEKAVYRRPTIRRLGSAVALTNGTAKDDTSDMRKYYY